MKAQELVKNSLFNVEITSNHLTEHDTKELTFLIHSLSFSRGNDLSGFGIMCNDSSLGFSICENENGIANKLLSTDNLLDVTVKFYKKDGEFLYSLNHGKFKIDSISYSVSWDNIKECFQYNVSLSKKIEKVIDFK